MKKKEAQVDTNYFQKHLLQYDSVCKKLTEQALTYGDNNQSIAFFPDDKRVLLCTHIIKSINSYGELLNNKYKDLIEIIATHPTVGVCMFPLFLFNEKPRHTSTAKMTIKYFISRYSGYKKVELHNKGYINSFELTSVIYYFHIFKEDVYVRYHLLDRDEAHHDEQARKYGCF